MNTTQNLKIPNHIAYIIDGNGRWAKKRGMPRSYGHKIGFNTLRKIIKESFKLGIKYVSVYAFSTENWNRPKEEIDYLITLFRKYIKTDFMKDFKDVRLNVMGDYTKFPADLVEAVNKTLNETKDNKKFVLNLGINYGGRDEILYAINKAILEGVRIFDKDTIANYLYTKNQPDPDFIIRTSGEQRISNFMLWQCAYSEFYFPSTYWPDFNKKELLLALEEFSKRDRRYGKIKAE